MPRNQFSQNSNETHNTAYSSDGFEKTKLRKLLLVVIGVFAAIVVIAFVVYLSQSESQQSKYTKSAMAAARKVNPNAVASKVKVASGFAMATVSDPTAESQANSGNLTFFKVNKGGSMTQIASGSEFSPIDLLRFGIPLATQAQLTGRNLIQVQQDLAATCGYSGGNVPGFFGFNGSFNPGGWEIDAATLGAIEQALTATVSNENADVKVGEKIVCVNATREKSNFSTDKQTYISTYTLELQFITGNGAISTHMFTFAIGFSHYRAYTLDGQKIQASS